MALLPVIKSNEGSGGLLPVIKATPQPIAPAKPLPLQPKIAAAKPLPAPAPIQAAQPLQADNTNIPVVGDYAKLGQLVKQKYPEYQTMDDEELGKRTIAKYPEYAPSTLNVNSPKPEKNTSGLGLIGSATGNVILPGFGTVFSNPEKVKNDSVDMIKGFTSPLRTIAATLVRGTEAVPTQIAGIADSGAKLLGLKPDDGGRYQDELKAKEQIIKNKPFLGAKSVAGQTAKENIGSALETGALLLPSSGAVKGATSGFIGGFGSTLKDGGTFGEATRSGLLSSFLGGTVGKLADGAGVINPNASLGNTGKQVVGNVLQKVGGESESGVTGYLARQGRNLERVATEAPIVNKETSSLAKVAGIDDTIARDIQALNSETKQILSKMTDEAEATGRSLKPKNRMEFVGQEVAKRASQLDTVLKGLKNKYNAAIVSSNVDKGLVKEDIFNTATELAQALESQGVVVLPKGELDFSDSVLNSANLASERGAIESIWKELMRASNTADTPLTRLHNIEKYITGTELPKLSMSNEAKTIVTEVRNSIRDKIDARVGGKYQKLVGDYRKAKAVEEQIDGIVNSTITDAKSAGLLSTQEANDLVAKDIANKLTRLTNKAGVKISTFLEAMDNGLGQLGVKNKPIDYETIANFNELLDDIVGSSQRGSLTGRLQRQVAGGIQMAQDIATGNAKGVTDKILGGVVDRLGSVSHEEKIRALKKLLQK